MKQEVAAALLQWTEKLIATSRNAPLYRVYITNDDFTPMEFVVSVLEAFFGMDREKAVAVMLEAHQSGRAMCGVYGHDVAQTKVQRVIEHAASYEHPLLCRMEAA